MLLVRCYSRYLYSIGGVLEGVGVPGPGAGGFPGFQPWPTGPAWRGFVVSARCRLVACGLCAVTTLTAFAHAIGRKGGPGGDYTWEVVRLLNAKSEYFIMVLCVRPCSQTTRLPCVAEGGSLFAATEPAGDRAPFETIGRCVCFSGAPRVRAGGRESKIIVFELCFLRARP